MEQDVVFSIGQNDAQTNIYFHAPTLNIAVYTSFIFLLSLLQELHGYHCFYYCRPK